MLTRRAPLDSLESLLVAAQVRRGQGEPCSAAPCAPTPSPVAVAFRWRRPCAASRLRVCLWVLLGCLPKGGEREAGMWLASDARNSR